MKMQTLVNRGYIILALIPLLPIAEACSQQSPKISVEKTVNDISIGIHYFSPKARGRVIWGDLVPYDEVWRTGANNATVFEVSKNVKIDGKVVPAGKYALFTIPTKEGTWTVILNKTHDQWGAYNYDQKEDQLRFMVKTQRTIELTEDLTFSIEDDGNVIFKWEYLSFRFQVLPG